MRASEPRYQRLANEISTLKKKYTSVLNEGDRRKKQSHHNENLRDYAQKINEVNEAAILTRVEKMNNELERQLRLEKELHALKRDKYIEKRKKEKYERKLAEATMKEHWNNEQMDILHDSLSKESNAALEMGKALRQKDRDNTQNPVATLVKRKPRVKSRRRGRQRGRGNRVQSKRKGNK